MIKRNLGKKLTYFATKLPVLAVLGPRQSGKTTLTKAVFSSYNYVNLEDMETRQFAQTDPKGFIRENRNIHGLIIDEVQRVPELLSTIQVVVDEEKKMGTFIITGSQNILLNQSISQSLAGRVALLTLLPLSIDEFGKNNMLPDSANQIIWQGCYPRIYDASLEPTEWYPFYINTYVERDVRQIINVADLNTFKRFLGLCAGRIGQLLNIASLAQDCGISPITAKSWLSVLEATYIIFLLQPYHQNFSKRLIKSPKLFFYDTGLACSLLGIKSREQLLQHYLRGGLFESMIISDFYKIEYNNANQPAIFFWRDSVGNEVDCIIEHNASSIPVEIKASETIQLSFFKGLEYWNSLTGSRPENSFLLYAGEKNQLRQKGRVISWQSTEKVFSK